MNVTCTGCPARYAVPDEKVRGKKVKITCKHCGTAIIVDGTGGAQSAQKSARPAAAARPSEPVVKPKAEPARATEPPARTEPQATPESTWLVGFADDRQEPARTSKIVELYATKQIDAETFVWKDGMPSWLTPFEVPEIATALLKKGFTRPPAEPAPAAPSFPDADLDDDKTQVVPPGFDFDAHFGTGPAPEANETAAEAQAAPREAEPAPKSAPREPEPAPESAPREPEPAPKSAPREDVSPAKLPSSSRASATASSETAAAGARPRQRTVLGLGDMGKAVSPRGPSEAQQPAPEAVVPSSKPAARRRAERGRGEEFDLFANLDQAGSEDDQAGSEDESVQSAERATTDAPRLTGARNESSVLFSLDALIKTEKNEPKPAPKKREDAASLLFGDAPPDSLMNVGGGGIASALAAPDFTAPVAAVPQPVAVREAPKSASTAPAIEAEPRKRGGLGIVVALLGLLVVGGAVAFGLGLPQKWLNRGAPSLDPLPTSVAPPAANEAPAPDPTEPTPEATMANDAGAPDSADAAADAALEAAVGTPTAQSPNTPSAPAAAAAPQQAAAKPADKPAEPAPEPEPAPAAASTPFDRDAAVAALGSAAANASSCKKSDGPTGTGKVSVTFAPSGRATMATVQAGAFQGTEVGSCVARLFRSTKVPPFAGDPVTVSKTFVVQ